MLIVIKIIVIILIIINKYILIHILKICFYQEKIINIVTNLILKRIVFIVLLLKILIFYIFIWSL
jgi:hypothetical protein